MTRRLLQRIFSSNLALLPLICFVLILLVFLAYGQVTKFNFTCFDDTVYLTENRHVSAGLTADSFDWSFRYTGKEKTYWHPLTWLSHMLDVELYGMDAGLHHLNNIIFHIANTILLFCVLFWMTGALWRSAFVAALFALHPFNVESVAWVAERKNVLSTFFGMLTLLAYTGYVKQPNLWRYGAVLGAFCLGLLAKPMLVTLPFVLLLLDYWPLGRIEFRFWRPVASKIVLLEKLPLLLLAGLSVFVSSASIQGMDNAIPLQSVPMLLRVANGLVSYLNYVGKMFWPINLAVFYPYPQKLPALHVLGALVLIGGITASVIWALRRHPYLVVGWLWFLGTLVPVIGLLQVGLWPAMADRWAYVPLIGLFIMATWGVSCLWQSWRFQNLPLVLAGCLVLAALFGVTRMQIRNWATSVTLFEHTLKVTQNNALAHNMLAYALAEDGEIKEAIGHIYAGLKIQPKNAGAYNNLGNIFLQQGNINEAVDCFKKAVALNENLKEAHYNLGIALMQKGEKSEAVNHYLEALRIDSDDVNIHNNLGNAFFEQGNIRSALKHYARALQLKPNDPELRNNLGVALIQTGKLEEAIKQFQTALRLKPGYVDASNNLHKALALK